MTENDAITKWCPMARAKDNEGNGSTLNRQFGTGHPDKDCMCLGSNCMVWRWEKEEQPEGRTGSPTVFLPTGEEWVCKKCEGTGKIYTQEHKFYANMRYEPCDECEGDGKGRKYAPSGYCGLAGKEGIKK